MNTRILLACLVSTSIAACGGGGGNGKGGGNRPPANTAPTAQMSVTATTGHAPLQIDFDASQSTDADGTIVSFAWDFGDGNSAIGAVVSHTYTDVGLYTAVITITDDDGATSTRSSPINAHAQIAGFYFGGLTSNAGMFTDLVAFIGANNEMQAWDYVNLSASYWGVLDVSAGVVSGTVSAEVLNPALTFPDGTRFGTVSVAGDVAERLELSGTYSGVGDSGTLFLDYISAVSEQVFTLDDLSGTWSFSDGLGFSDSLTVSATGALTYDASDGCTGSGQLTILDPDLNGFSFSIDLQCAPGLLLGGNGVRTGVGWVDDQLLPETWIFIAGAIDQTSLAWAWNRPKAVAASATAAAKPSGLAAYGPRSSRHRRQSSGR